MVSTGQGCVQDRDFNSCSPVWEVSQFLPEKVTARINMRGMTECLRSLESGVYDILARVSQIFYIFTEHFFAFT